MTQCLSMALQPCLDVAPKLQKIKNLGHRVSKCEASVKVREKHKLVFTPGVGVIVRPSWLGEEVVAVASCSDPLVVASSCSVDHLV